MNLNEIIRRLIKEVVDVAIEPVLAAGRTFDVEQFRKFMKGEGLSGHEDNILSIIEGRPDQSVLNDVMEYIAFHGTGEIAEQLSAETMLEYYIAWNHLNIDKTKVLAFSISEK